VQRDSVLRPVERYYTAKVTEHGAVPAGVDWNSDESQELRFRQLLKIVDVSHPFSINDVGCGYGALALLVDRVGYDCTYSGFDISPAMIARARSDVGETPRRSFSDDETSLEPADYSVASGIFNVKLAAPEDEWEAYILRTLDTMDALSRRGFAFNMLTSYSDPERKRDDLFYADPGFFFDHCKRRYSRHVALLHDYGLWEFTVLVRSEPAE
jgi:SAM-dependent methyltransferase